MRAFFCIPLPGAARSTIHQTAEALRLETRMRAAWVPESNYHITLRFLGDIDPMLTVDLQACMKRALAGLSPFECTLDRVGAFPRLDRARVLWIGGDAPEGFRALADSLGRGLTELGFPRARREILAHVTVARIKDQPDPRLVEVVERLTPWTALKIRVDRVVLMESRLSPRGAEYTPLFSGALGA